MTVSPPRRALRELLGTDLGFPAEPPAGDGHSVARRALARLLGVPLAAPAERRGPALPVTSASPGREGAVSAAEAIAASDPVVRLTVRQSPLTIAVPMAELLVRAVDIVGDRVSSARRVNHGNPAHARTFSYDLHRALTLVRSLDLELDLYHVPALDRALNRALDLALGGAPDRARDRDRARNLARDLARDLERVLTLARDHGHNFEFAFELARALALALVLDRALDREHARALVLDRALGREHARERALDRARELACVAAEALNESLGIERLDGLADALLDGALDDFSQADLSRANPAHMRLVGVRWSMSGTRWPPGLDVGTLVQQSKETEPGSGIYVVTHGGETRRAQEETRV